MVASFFPALDNFTPCGINMAAAPRLHPDGLKRETFLYSPSGKERGAAPGKPASCSQSNRHLDEQLHPASWNRVEFSKDRRKGKRKCGRQTNAVLTNANCPRETEISSLQ